MNRGNRDGIFVEWIAGVHPHLSLNQPSVVSAPFFLYTFPIVLLINFSFLH